MGFFYKKVDLRSKKAMVDFLGGHFRYHTMNSWNLSTSYANCIKLHRIGLTRTQENAAFDMYTQEDVWDELNSIMHDFGIHNNFAWQAGCNGRSGGYVVLYQGGRREDGRPFSYPGRGVDENEDFDEWDMGMLRGRVRLVQEFDRMCDNMRDRFIDFCDTCRIVQETIMVPRTVSRVVCA